MKKILSVIALATVFAACDNNVKQNEVTVSQKEAIKKAVIDSIKLDSFQRAENLKKQELMTTQAALVSTRSTSGTSTRRSYSSSRPTYVKGYSESKTYSEPTTTRKKGWSHAAKGAAIGGAAGAVTGILVDKKDGRGAIIGGVLGAGTGYVIGRAKDRKTGRIQ